MSDKPQHEDEVRSSELLTEKELDEIAGGACATGQHLPEVKLISSFNQAETLSSNVQNKLNNTQNGIAGNIRG